MPVKRIFVAIEISEDVRLRIAQYAKQLQRDFPDLRVRWVRSENYHITLRFVGDVDEASLARLKDNVEMSCREFEPFELRIAGTGAFVKRDNAALWIGIPNGTGRDQMVDLIGKIDPESGRRSVPHLTIARIKAPHKARDLILKHKESSLDGGRFAVDQITIFESKLTPSGPIYSAISRHRLAR